MGGLYQYRVGSMALSSVSLRAFFLSTAACFAVVALPAMAQSPSGVGQLPPVTVTPPKEEGTKQAKQAARTQRSQASRRVTTPVRSAAQQAPALVGGSSAFGGMPGRGDVSNSVTALPAAVTVLDAPATRARYQPSPGGELW